MVSPSYMVLPVKRLPSKPWSGWPSVRGMSAAVMPMRTTVSAMAEDGSVSHATVSTPATRNNIELVIVTSLMGHDPLRRSVSRSVPPLTRDYSGRTRRGRLIRRGSVQNLLSNWAARGVPQRPNAEASTLGRKRREHAGIGLGPRARVGAALGRPETECRKRFGERDGGRDAVNHGNAELRRQRGGEDPPCRRSRARSASAPSSASARSISATILARASKPEAPVPAPERRQARTRAQRRRARSAPDCPPSPGSRAPAWSPR